MIPPESEVIQSRHIEADFGYDFTAQYLAQLRGAPVLSRNKLRIKVDCEQPKQSNYIHPICAKMNKARKP